MNQRKKSLSEINKFNISKFLNLGADELQNDKIRRNIIFQ